jgi:hypothetical protein
VRYKDSLVERTITEDNAHALTEEKERFAHPVVRRAVERDTCPDHALKRVSQLRARWIENREMIESSGAWRQPDETLPRIQADMVRYPPVEMNAAPRP